MHFSICKNRNAFKGCGGAPHVHLWGDAEETHDLILNPRLTTKKVAMETTEHLLRIMIYDENERQKIFNDLQAQLDAIDLTKSEAPIARGKSSVSHLKRIK